MVIGGEFASVYAQAWRDRGGLYVFYTREPQSTLEWPQLNVLMSDYRSFLQRFADPDVREEIREGDDGETFIVEVPGGGLLPELQFGHDYSIGAGFIVATLNAEASWHNLYEVSRATLKQGVVRTFEVSGRTWRFNVGILAPIGALELGGFMGMHAARGEVRSFGTFPDGTISYGDDNGINGIWSLESLDLTAGVKAMIRVGPVALYGRAEWVDPFNVSGQLTTVPLAITQNTYRGSGVRANSDNFTLVEFLPARMQDFGKSVLINNEPVVDNKFAGFTLHVGIALVLGANSE
ncbi:MAG: hypothetical protein RhofKO_04530 [Rhodothermales bacterium]